MADRQWFVAGQQVYETGTEEYFVAGVQLNEDQAAAPPAGRTTKNTDPYNLGVNLGMSRTMNQGMMGP